MMTSLFSAAASLRAHQSGLDVLGNNIANINTPGYKAEQARFQETLVATLRGASAPANGLGGRNPVQVGQGASVSGVARSFTNGAPQATGRPLDLALAGDGFFVVGGSGADPYYTRDGSFWLDADGQLVTAGGQKVLGWSGEGAAPGGALGPLRVPVDEVMPAKATTTAALAGNLDAGAEVGATATATLKAYDSLGEAHLVTVTFTKSGAGAWDWAATGPDGSAAGSGSLTFAAAGALSSGATGSLQVALPASGAASPVALQLELGELTQVAGAGTPSLLRQDGLPAGTLRDLAFDERGVLIGLYTNGARREIGRVALARFANPEGLLSVGGNLFQASVNSGQPQSVAAGEDASLKLMSGALEMSNVDLSAEFTRMILTQRGFQANAKVVTTADEVLQELMQLKR